jgi:uncharacterized protein (DUF1810 family)
MVVPDLNRYLDAQNEPHSGFACALEEIRAGGKQGHWVWYIFPQLIGLGYSPLSRRYAISNLHEARAYLQNQELRKRLLAITAAVAELLRTGHPLTRVMGSSIDATKLVSSLTLFAHVARALHVDEQLDAYRDVAALAEEVLAAAAAQGYPKCRFTLDQIRDWEGSRSSKAGEQGTGLTREAAQDT